jgi:hypothetical protein
LAGKKIGRKKNTSRDLGFRTSFWGFLILEFFANVL